MTDGGVTLTPDLRTGPLSTTSRSLHETIRVVAPGRPWDTIEDLEKLCVGAREEAFRKWKHIRHDLDPDETLQHLFVIAYGKLAAYRPRNDTSRLRGWLYPYLRWGVLDLWRQRYGKNGERGRREVLTDFTLVDDDRDNTPSFDAGRGTASDGRPGATRGLLDARRASAVDWEDAVGRLHAAGDRVGAGAIDSVGVGPSERPPTGDPGPVAGTGRPRARVGESASGGGAFRDCVACQHRMYRQAPNGKPGWHWPDRCPACGSSLT